jgi:replicative DNA helicase
VYYNGKTSEVKVAKAKKTKKNKKAVERKTAPKRNKPFFKTELDKYLTELNRDEEMILANLAFDPIIAGKQLLEVHFNPNDFQGIEANRILLGTMLEIIEDGATLNLPNVMARLTHQTRNDKKLIDLVGGSGVIEKLFNAPFAKQGISLQEDLQPLIESIRDRNVRGEAHKLLVKFSEQILKEGEDAYEMLGSCIQDLRKLFLKGSTGYLRTIDSHLEEMRELIDGNRAARRDYLGHNTNFPILTQRLSGFQKEFYLITGGVGMGKSTFATQLAWDLTSLNPGLTVIFFSLDLNRIDATAKIVSQAAEVPIDYVKNPYMTRENFEEKRLEGLDLVAEKRDRLILVDESSGRLFLEDIKKYVKRTKLERGGDIAVIIDPIFKIQVRGQHQMNFNEKCNFLAAELKSLSAVEGVTLIATAGLPKAISNRRPTREDLEEIMGLLYDPYAVFFIYCDYLNNFETPFLEWEWGEDSFMVPISEILVAKNKMGGINTRIFYRYYEAYSKYKECAPQEVENYSAMIDNLEKYKENKSSADARKSSGRREEF